MRARLSSVRRASVAGTILLATLAGASLPQAPSEATPGGTVEGKLPPEIAGLRLLPRSHKVASSPDLSPAVGGLARHFAEKGVVAAERGLYSGGGRGRVEVLLLAFSDAKKAKDYYLFWRAVRLLSGPVRDLDLRGADACSLSVGSGEWALLSGPDLALVRPIEGGPVLAAFLEGLASALRAPPKPPAIELKLPLAEVEGRPMVALRALAEALKAPLTYDPVKGEAILRIGPFALSFKPGRAEVLAGEGAIALPSPPILSEGRIYLAPEAVEALTGARAAVDRKAGLVRLIFPATSPPPSRPSGPPGAEGRAPGYTGPTGASEGAGGRVP